MSSGFFTETPPGRPGLAVFLNAGDPPLDVLRELVLRLDALKVDCLELAVPFPNSPSDGPVIRESADRALADGVDRDAVFAFVESVRPQLGHLKIALLADWSYSMKDLPVRDFVERVQASGADGLLVHGMPPRLRPAYYETAREVGQPIVTTCYSSSQPTVIEEAADNGSAYIYLVSAYGKSGTVGPPDHSALKPVLQTLRERTAVPIAVGFGVKTRGDIEALGEVGADAAIVGSACVACVADALANGRDVVEDFQALLVELGAAPQLTGAGLPE
ncbi:MAG TPA: tryptophan synthase subunit alpha [Gaiellaceae bacterium]|nr:tryptophan synthase subunit alpha [Gaiellaceae bacterium]